MLDDKPATLRSVWVRETSFCKWLSRIENLVHLQNVLSLPLRCLAIEFQYDKYRADMLCQISGTMKEAIIEVQFTKSDHDHLGKLLAYGHSGTACKVWIAPEFEKTHLEALRNANRESSSCKYFAVLVGEEWYFDNQWIPSFRVLEAPKSWDLRHEIRTHPTKEERLFYARYWQELKDLYSPDSIISTMHDSTGPTTVCDSLQYGFRVGATVSKNQNRTSVFLLCPMEDTDDYWIGAFKQLDRKLRQQLKEQIPHVSTIKFIAKGTEQSAIEIFTVSHSADDFSRVRMQQLWIRDALHKLQSIVLPYIELARLKYEL